MSFILRRFWVMCIVASLATTGVGCGGSATREVEAPPDADPNAGLMNPDQDPTMNQAEESLVDPAGDPAGGPPT